MVLVCLLAWRCSQPQSQTLWLPRPGYLPLDLKRFLVHDSHLYTNNLTPGPDLARSINVCSVDKYFTVKTQSCPTLLKILICYSRNAILSVFTILDVLLIMIFQMLYVNLNLKEIRIKKCIHFLHTGFG